MKTFFFSANLTLTLIDGLAYYLVKPSMGLGEPTTPIPVHVLGLFPVVVSRKIQISVEFHCRLV